MAINHEILKTIVTFTPSLWASFWFSDVPLIAKPILDFLKKKAKMIRDIKQTAKLIRFTLERTKLPIRILPTGRKLAKFLPVPGQFNVMIPENISPIPIVAIIDANKGCPINGRRAKRSIRIAIIPHEMTIRIMEKTNGTPH
jgi:DNA-directed RNA polymerase specialized sigma subunit